MIDKDAARSAKARSVPLMEEWQRERLSCLLQILSTRKLADKIGLSSAGEIPAEVQRVLDAWATGRLPDAAERAALAAYIAELNAPLQAHREARKNEQRQIQAQRRRQKAADERAAKAGVLKKL